MVTLEDLAKKVAAIRAANEELEVKGSKNASLVVFMRDTCNELIQMINDTAKEILNQSEEVGENDARSTERDTATAG